MRILVTGAAGFLGSHLCDRLLAAGHRVVGMDNFITGSPANIAHLTHHPQFQFVRHDVTTFIDVEGPLEGVLHFASPASPVDYLELPIQTLKVGDTQGRSARNAQGAGPGESEGRALSARLDVRNLRRSPRAPPTRELLG